MLHYNVLSEHLILFITGLGGKTELGGTVTNVAKLNWEGQQLLNNSRKLEKNVSKEKSMK